MLLPHYYTGVIEAGCDEAGRGPLAGPVYAAAVILPPDYCNPRLDDSKKLTEEQRDALRQEIERDAVAWAVGTCTAAEIDDINILHAAFRAMHRAISQLQPAPQALIIDGNHFDPYYPTPQSIIPLPHTTIIKGDGKYQAIAAASILAKTYRDDHMRRLALQYPQYGWEQNKGYPTAAHRKAIAQYGFTPEHRKTFRVKI